jgi:PilZ domain
MEEDLKRRGCPRYPCAGAVEILQSGTLCGWGTVSEISRGGCYIETGHPLPLATEVQLRLTIADTLLDISAKVAWTTPQIGMGMRFEGVPPAQESKLAQILAEVTGGGVSPVVQQAEHPQPSGATVRITREAAPDVLAKVIKRINEKGVVTKQELIEIVKANP